MEAKFCIDKNAISSLEAQFYYVYSRFDRKIQTLVILQLSNASEARN